MKEQVKELWKRCFHDSEAFTELYFRLRYSEEANIALQSGEEVVAALQMLPYPMTFAGGEIETAYVSGACTHPDCRNRGLMHRLLSEAFARMRHNGVLLSTLIPAEPWLFGYYARKGYATVFRSEESLFIPSHAPLSAPSFTLTLSAEYADEKYAYLHRKLQERPCCIQHTAEDFRVILADLQLEKGWVATLHDAGERILALAIAYPAQHGEWRIGEIVADTPETGQLLLQRLCQRLGLPALRVPAPATPESAPLGMGRIIHAPALLQRYAAAHPEAALSFCLTDEQLPANNGCYHLSHGTCTKSAKQLPGSHLALTIGQLTERIFAASAPCMSLMLN